MRFLFSPTEDIAPMAWRPIAEAPHDPELLVEVFAPAREGLAAFICLTRWHPDAGWCVDELRHATHYRLPRNGGDHGAQPALRGDPSLGDGRD